MQGTMSQLSDFAIWSPDSNDHEMIKDVYDVVTQLELWDWIKTYNPSNGFMYTPPTKEVQQINAAMKYTGHSGASYGWTMRKVQYMARNNWRIGMPLPV